MSADGDVIWEGDRISFVNHEGDEIFGTAVAFGKRRVLVKLEDSDDKAATWVDTKSIKRIRP